jgi:hypothetical protein
MTGEEARWAVSRGLHGSGLRDKDMTVTAVLAVLRRGGDLLEPARGEQGDPLMHGRPPGEGLTQRDTSTPKVGRAGAAGGRWKTAVSGAKGMGNTGSGSGSAGGSAPKMSMMRLAKELKTLTLAQQAAIAAVRDL